MSDIEKRIEQIEEKMAELERQLTTRPVHKRRVKLIEPKTTKYEETPVKVYRIDPNEIKA